MRKYVASAAAALAVGAALFGGPVIAGAQARAISHTEKGQMDSITFGKGRARHELYVERTQHSTQALAASCLAGQLSPNYCTPPKYDDLFGSFSMNDGSTTFGSTVKKAPNPTCEALGYSSSVTTCGVFTNVANELIVAFVQAGGPTSGGQSITVSCTTASGGSCPVTFHRVAAENAAGTGDSEVWYADATSIISQSAPIFVKASVGEGCGQQRWGNDPCDVSLQAVTFQSAITAGASGAQGTGIGASSVCASKSGAPSCSLKTTEPDSMVWSSAEDPVSATIPTWPSNQFAIGVADRGYGYGGYLAGAFYTQFAGTCTAGNKLYNNGGCGTFTVPSSGQYQNPYTISPTSFGTLGTTVTINDTAPTNEPFNLVDVEIL